MKINIVFREEKSMFFLNLDPCDKSVFDISVDAAYKPVIVHDVDDYTGTYDVRPSASSQTLYTQGLRMTDDVTIQEIPYYETTNESGGYTVIIGE